MAPKNLGRRVISAVFAMAALSALAACVESTDPILTDGKPMLGERVRFQLYDLRDGLAYDPEIANFRWDGSRYRNVGRRPDIGSFTVHSFEGGAFILQSFGRTKGRSIEYAVAQKLTDGVFRVVAVDQDDADEATRAKFCIVSAEASCRITTREQLEAFARATAAKPQDRGGLAIQLSGHRP